MQIQIKRVYEPPVIEDGYRILVDRLWPRGMKKESLKYDLWAKDLTPSPSLRAWFHEDTAGRWNAFAALYHKQLNESGKVSTFVQQIRNYPVVTLLYASKDPVHNHAKLLEEFLEKHV